MSTIRRANLAARASRQLLALVFALVPLLTAAVVHAQGGPPATPVHGGPVLEQELQERRRVTGDLRAVARSRVATIEQGLVVEAPVEEGDVVREGDVLAVLDARRLTIAVEQIAARVEVEDAILAAREAELRQAKFDLESLKTLLERSAGMPKELADAQATVDIAQALRDEADRNQAVTSVAAQLAQTRLDDMTIRAPFAGIVVSKLAEKGQWLGEGAAVVEIVSNDAYDAWLDVPQRLAPALLGTDARIEVQVDATSRMLTGARPTIVPLVDLDARSFNIYVRFDNEDGALAAGMSVIGWVPTGAKTTYKTVPRVAIMRDSAGFYVYTGRPGHGGGVAATRVPVDVLFATADRMAVQSSSLKDGDLVVVEGNERLHPMMPIRFAGGNEEEG